MLKFSYIVTEFFNVRKFNDKRKKENALILSYIDESGKEYRKRLSFPVTISFDDMKKAIPETIENNKYFLDGK
jgi:hypothetical protein